MNISQFNSQVVLNSMSIELADLKSADPSQGKQLQTQMLQQLQQFQQLQQEQQQSPQDSAQQARGSLIDVNA
jgi:hypothetical protein